MRDCLRKRLTRVLVALLQAVCSYPQILLKLPSTIFGVHVNNIHFALTPLISLVAGILILIMPKLLNFIVAIYLIIIGLVGLFGGGSLRL